MADFDVLVDCSVLWTRLSLYKIINLFIYFITVASKKKIQMINAENEVCNILCERSFVKKLVLQVSIKAHC